MEVPKYQQEDLVALKFPRRRVRNTETHNAQDMNESIYPVVEEMGRLNEHNFNQTMAAQLNISDLERDVAFNTIQEGYFIDVSDKNLTAITTAWAGGHLHRIPQDNRWGVVWPSKLSKTFSSLEGGMFRIVAGGQWGSERIAVVAVSSYLIYSLRVDGGIIPDSAIGDQDFAQEHAKMEKGQGGQLGAFLIDFTMYLGPGSHTVEVVVNNTFLKNEPRRTPLVSSPTYDAYVGSAEILIWEMHR